MPGSRPSSEGLEPLCLRRLILHFALPNHQSELTGVLWSWANQLVSLAIATDLTSLQARQADSCGRANGSHARARRSDDAETPDRACPACHCGGDESDTQSVAKRRTISSGAVFFGPDPAHELEALLPRDPVHHEAIPTCAKSGRGWPRYPIYGEQRRTLP